MKKSKPGDLFNANKKKITLRSFSDRNLSSLPGRISRRLQSGLDKGADRLLGIKSKKMNCKKKHKHGKTCK